MMFRIVDNAIKPHKRTFQNARKLLPQVHESAENEAMSHLHRLVTGSVEEGGVDSTGLGVGINRGHLELGIAHSPAGDSLFKTEYGHVYLDEDGDFQDEAPRPIVRTSVARHFKTANDLYSHRIWTGIGL